MSAEENKDLLTTYRILHEAVKVVHAHGVEYAVLCPGSRSAPIALSFLRFKNVKCFILPDERSAGYTALGIAKATQKPVALVCTSGTAALNFGPAIAEAFFSEVPLIVFTADRPPEWLGQADNQAIYQDRLYSRHVKAHYTLPVDLQHPDAQWHAIRQVNEAMNIAVERGKGPVHINVPLRESLYLQDVPDFGDAVPRITRVSPASHSVDSSLFEELSKHKKILCVAGMCASDEELKEILEHVIRNKGIVLVPDITSNLTDIPGAVSLGELTIENGISKELKPDLTLSFGGPIVSRTIKSFLRENDVPHWHIGQSVNPADTYQRLRQIVPVSPVEFFSQWSKQKSSVNSEYKEQWQNRQEQVHRRLVEVFDELPFSEIKAIGLILDSLPKDSVLHLGNSLPVRYASVFPLLPQGIEVFANRGTSGIDGCVSSAAGHSMADKRIQTAIVGDLTFLYDSNGLWNNYLKPNLKIIVLNNHGGGIFRSLPGSARQPELEEYFVVKQANRVEHTALQHGCEYFYCDNEKELEAVLTSFYGISDKPAVLELDFKKQLMIGEVKEKIRKHEN
jgi:2-succinyl-5-enolpyruvyl-6-hydroxy-3-cyclohexene-1-carboxylate synthase